MNETQEFIQKNGYRFDWETVKDEHRKHFGKAPTSTQINLYETVAYYAVMAHQHGLEGGKLSGLLPFIKESVPAATETQETQEPKPLYTCGNSITPGAALQEESE